MIKFIQQEASEKAQEIKLKADEEYNIEKLYMVEEEKQKIRQEYERKEKQVEVQKRMCAPPARPCGVVAAPARATGEGGCLRRPPARSVGLSDAALWTARSACASPPPCAVLSRTRSDTRD